MAQRAAVRTTYEVDRTLQPIYSGGSLSLSEDGRILAASLGEEVLLTDLTNGKELGRVEGDGEVTTALACKCPFYEQDIIPADFAQ
jgi:U3 small nucleolar RNA-associated protein 13